MAAPCFFLLLVALSVVDVESISIEDVVQKSSKSRPMNGGTGPLRVHIGFYLESIGNFRATEMSFDVDLYVYMSWRDSRLSHNSSSHVLINDVGIRNQMWLPDLYFANARQARFQDVTVPNFNMFVANDGTVAYSCRATCSISCALNLVNYPMDKQKCHIRVLSYAHVAEQVHVSWFSSQPIRYNENIGLPEFSITNVTEAYCEGHYRYALTETTYKSGNFSCLMGEIFLSRSIGYNLVQSYIPTGLIVMISWVSFWIDRRAVPARVTLSFTTLVSLTTLGNGLRFGLPQVSYAKAIDLWYGACMFFVFCALLEFAVINSCMRKSEKYDHIAKTFVNSPRFRSIMRKVTRAEAPTMEEFNNNKKEIRKRRVPTHAKRGRPNSANEPILFMAEENDGRLPHKVPILNGAARNGGLPRRLPCLNEESSLSEAPNKIGFIDSRAPTEIMESMSTVSVYDNVVPPLAVKKATEEEEEVMMHSEYLLSDSEEETQHTKMKEKMAEKRKEGTEEGRKYSVNTSTFYTTLSIESSRRALKIDKICRYLFPGSFLVFNIIYWNWYLVIKPWLVANNYLGFSISDQ